MPAVGGESIFATRPQKKASVLVASISTSFFMTIFGFLGYSAEFAGDSSKYERVNVRER